MRNKNLLFVVLTMLSVISISSCKKDGNDPLPAIVIGQSYQGGIVFYVDATGQHGLIATTSDQSTGASWQNGCGFCCNSVINGANGTAIGTGAQNTVDIIRDLGTLGEAARICDQLSFGGYEDWFLPSKDELYLLWQQRTVVGIPDGAWDEYWSSTQVDECYAIGVDYDGSFFNNPKSDPSASVRAVRAF